MRCFQIGLLWSPWHLSWSKWARHFCHDYKVGYWKPQVTYQAENRQGWSNCQTARFQFFSLHICCQWTQPSMLPWGQDRVSSQSFHQKCFFSFVTVLIPCVFTFRSLSKLFWKWARMLYPVQLPLCVQELGARNQTHRKPTAWWPHLTRSKSKVPVWVPLCSLKGVLRS